MTSDMVIAVAEVRITATCSVTVLIEIDVFKLGLIE